MSGPSRRGSRREIFLADDLVGSINRLRLDENEPQQVVCTTNQHYSQHLGGYIRSFSFKYEDGAPFSQGFVYLESPLDDRGIMELQATFVVLTEEEDQENIAKGVYDISNQLYGYGGAIANIYLSGYCNKLKKWVLGYEKFDHCFDNMISNLPPFYESTSRISVFWIHIIRQIIESLSVLHENGVMHGGLLYPESYVLDSNLNIKLINIGRYSIAGRSTFYHDIIGFFGYLCSRRSLDVSSQEWCGFEYLYRSEEAMNDRSCWKDAILGHPILLSPKDKLECYMDIHAWTQRLNMDMRANFANALYCKMPFYLDKITRGERRSITDFIDNSCKPCMKIVSYIDTDKIYIDIIYYARHFADHGHGYGEHWNSEKIHDKICEDFPGYMSMAYSIREVNRDGIGVNSAWASLFASLDRLPPYTAGGFRKVY